MKTNRLKYSSAGHVGFVGRQPVQCHCLICGGSMASPHSCFLLRDELMLLCEFIRAHKQWRKQLLHILTHDDNKYSEIYPIAQRIGANGIRGMKLTGDIADRILDRKHRGVS